MCQIMHLILSQVETAYIFWELLLQARTKFEGIRSTILLQVSVVEERGGSSVSDLCRAQINCNHALVVGIEDKLQLVLVSSICRTYQLDAFLTDVGVVLQRHALFDSSLQAMKAWVKHARIYDYVLTSLVA